MRNVAIVGTGNTQLGRRNDAGRMFDVNYRELKIGDRDARKIIRVKWLGNKIKV